MTEPNATAITPETLMLAMGDVIQQEINAPHFMNRMVDTIASLLEADRGTMYLLDADRGKLVSVAAHLPELQELEVDLGQGVAGYVATHDTWVNVPLSGRDDRFWGDVDKTTGYTTKSMLAGPLHGADEALIGVLQLLNKTSGPAFSQQDQQHFKHLCEQASQLLQHTTLTHPLLAPQEDASPSPEQPHDPPLKLDERFNRVIGQGPVMRAVFRTISRVAPTEASILLRGESGTGKGVIARALHVNSKRHAGPFVHVDSTTLPETLIENELFGHERGAYTGAHERKLGRVELADGGTLFLDEIGDLPLPLQSKLLTLLQDFEFYRVGGSKRLKANLRIIAATNRDLEALVTLGKFREDLYYRLKVVEINLPALRDRGPQDLLALIAYFIQTSSKRHHRPPPSLRPDARQMLLSYHWPGNVRELEHCIEAAVIFADQEITPSTLSLPRANTTKRLNVLPSTRALFQSTLQETLAQQHTDPHTLQVTDQPSLRELEGRYIKHLLQLHQGNRSECARILEIGRNTLIRKIKEHQLEDE